MGHWTENYWTIQPTDNRVRERALAFNRLLVRESIKKILEANEYSITSSMQDIHDAISDEGAYTREDLTWSELDRLEETCQDCENKERVYAVFFGYTCPKCGSSNYKMHYIKNI